jgi:uncharacterized protein
MCILKSPGKRTRSALLVIVPRERTVRLEVGYGLEGRLTDVQSNRIVRNVMAAHFKAGDFAFGIMGRSKSHSENFSRDRRGCGGGSSGSG